MSRPNLNDLDIIKRPHSKDNYNETDLLELMQCIEDPLFFMRSFMKVQHPTRGALSFEPFEYQKRMVAAMHEYRFSILMTARQAGKTTCAAGYILWRAMFVPDSTILIVANKFSQALEVMDRVRFCYENLPDHIRAGVTEYNKGTIVFDNGSKITSRATSADAGRGLAVSLLYCDEFAFVPPNKQKEFWTSIQPTLACVTGDTLVLTRDGFKKIETFHINRQTGDYFEIQDLEVWGKHGLETVSNGYVSPNSDTLIVETEKGFRVEVTPDHPLYAISDNIVPCMTKATNLKISDQLRIDIGMNIFGSRNIDLNLAYMIGGWIAEGWISRGYQIEISNTDPDFRNVYLNSQIVKSFKAIPSNPSRLMCCSKELCSIYADIGINSDWKCDTKRVPSAIWDCDQQTQGSFLQGLFDGDGSVSNHYVMLASTSRGLLSDVQLMLSNMGIIATVRMAISADDQLVKENGRLLPQGKPIMSARDSYGLYISRSQFIKFKQKIGFKIIHKATKLQEMIETTIQNDDKILATPKTSSMVAFLNELFFKSGMSQLWFRKHGCRLEKALTLHSSKGTVTHKFLKSFFDLLTICNLQLTEDEISIRDELLGNFIWDRIKSITPSKNKTYDFTVPGTHSFLQNGILGSNTGGNCIITSTPKNDEDIFAQLWKGAEDNLDEFGNIEQRGVGKNGFYAVKVTWREHPERDDIWAKPFRESLGEARFQQEFECSFVTDDETLINPLTLTRMSAKPPAFYIGTSRWYEEPEPNKAYLVALDPSLGTNNDFAAIQVFQIPEMKQVAEWQSNNLASRHQVRALMDILYALDGMLREHPEQIGDPEIFWTFENNTIGEGVLTIIEDTNEDRFPGQLVTEPRRKGLQMKRVRRGLHTTPRNKLSACARLKSLIESDRMHVNSTNLLRELKNFVASGSTFKAKPGEHDDLVMSSLMVVRMLDIVLRWGTEAGDLREYIYDDELLLEQEPMPVVI